MQGHQLRLQHSTPPAARAATTRTIANEIIRDDCILTGHFEDAGNGSILSTKSVDNLVDEQRIHNKIPDILSKNVFCTKIEQKS